MRMVDSLSMRRETAILPLPVEDSVEGQHFVHGAGAVAIAVDSSVLEAGGADGGADALERLAVEGGIHLFRGELDAGDAAVVADAEAAKAEGGERVFGAFDLFKHLGGDAAAVFDARGEACGGGLVPDIERGGAGEGADIVFGQPRVGKWRLHGMLRSGLLAGAVVAGVVGVEAIDDVRDAAGGALALKHGEELVLAVEAAGGVVAGVVLAGELGGGDGDERNGLRGGEGDGLARDGGGRARPSPR